MKEVIKEEDSNSQGSDQEESKTSMIDIGLQSESIAAASRVLISDSYWIN